MRVHFTKVAVLFLVLAIALAGIGVGAAMWSKTLHIDGTVNTGEVNAIFTTANSTEDEEFEGKDVGSCSVTGAGTQTLNITINNGYPCYGCTVNFTIDNIGTIPVKVQSFNTSAVPACLNVTWPGLVIGTQIHPGGDVPGSMYIHVEQCADELATYNLSAEIYLVQWNEYSK